VRRASGFTLLEVVMAAGLLASGILALTMLQAQSLGAQRRVRIVRELVGLAESELERRAAVATAVAAGDCSVPPSAPGVVASCRSSAEPCAGASVPCGDPSADRALRIRVEVIGSGGQRFELSTIVARFPP
jgi:type II secretory pathway pseudopilin PulG